MQLPVYVIHWNAPDAVLETVAAVQRSEGVDPVVHVVDNSPGELRARLAGGACAGFDLIELEDNRGFAGAANVALEHCLRHHPTASHCVIAAHDLRPEPACLRSLLDAATGTDRIGVAGPRFGAAGDVVGGTWDGRRGRWLRAAPPYPALVEVDWLLGAGLLIAMDWVREHGGFDARLGSYVEDVDLCLRVGRSGWRVVCVTDAVAEEVGRSPADVTRAVDRNSLLVAAKLHGRRGLVRALALLLANVVRGFGASVAPARSSARRSASRAHLRSHLLALGDLALGWRLVLDMVRRPDRGTRLDAGADPPFRPRYDATRTEMVPFVPGEVRRVLDVGCSTGRFGAALREERPLDLLWGIDPEPADNPAYDRIVTGRFPEDLPAGQTFDCLVCNDVLEHVEDPWGLLDRLDGVLDPGGVVVASIPNVRHLSVVGGLVLRGRWEYADRGVLDRTHLRFFTAASARALFEGAGYRVERFERINLPERGRRGLLRRALLGRADDFFALQFAVVARRPG